MGSCRVQKRRTLAQDTVSGKHDLTGDRHLLLRQCYDRSVRGFGPVAPVSMRATLMHSCNSAPETQQTLSKAVEIRVSVLLGLSREIGGRPFQR
jgi:hypothetical protein